MFKGRKPLEVRMGPFSMKRVKPQSPRPVVLKYTVNNEDDVGYLSWVKCPLISLSLSGEERIL